MSNSDDDDNSTATPPSRPLSIGDESAVAMNVYGVGENVENSPRYVVLADYGPMGPAEVLLKEGDIVSLVKVGCGGWWFVKILHSTACKEINTVIKINMMMINVMITFFIKRN